MIAAGIPIKVNENIINNFDVSVVMPFYKKLNEFKVVFPKNYKYFNRNGIEVILVLDTPAEKEDLLNFISQYPFINWKIILNDRPHEWRNPAKPLNVGIRHASKNFIMVCSPESEMLTDVIKQLRQTFEDYDKYRHFAIGRVCFADNENINLKNYDNFHTIPFGSIMVQKDDLFTIGGYDESLISWGGDDNNLRARLEMIGVEELYVSDARMIHRDINNTQGKIRRSEPFAKISAHKLRHYFYPETPTPNGTSWGLDFNSVIYDWRHKPNWPILLKNYGRHNFLKHTVSSHVTDQDYFGVLLLVQSHNEARFIKDFLANVADYVDGIILLDDDSTDDSYDLAENPKLIFKGSKKRQGFNDLENRNILLELASFCPHNLCLFLDVDERLNGNTSSLRSLIGCNPRAFVLPFVHLWDSYDKFNSEYPGSHKGICLKYRLFSNIGFTHINANKRLHFRQVPSVVCTCFISEPYISHLGTLTEVDRTNKYNFYLSEDFDNCQHSYEHFSPLYKPTKEPTSSLSKTYIEHIISSLTFNK